MGLLTEPTFDELIARGCAGCGGARISFRAFLDGRLPLMGGEPVGALTWVYDGEKFIDGLFEASCADCGASLFSASECPRCHAAGGLARALANTNGWPVPRACPSCDGEEVRLIALLPAQVSWAERRAAKARTTVEMHEPGFHGFRVDCADCGTVAELVDRCPLCEAPGRPRARP